MAKKLLFGYPVCLACDTPDFDPEEMEMVVIESMQAGRLVALNNIPESRRDYLSEEEAQS